MPAEKEPLGRQVEREPSERQAENHPLGRQVEREPLGRQAEKERLRRQIEREPSGRQVEREPLDSHPWLFLKILDASNQKPTGYARMGLSC